MLQVHGARRHINIIESSMEKLCLGYSSQEVIVDILARQELDFVLNHSIDIQSGLNFPQEPISASVSQYGSFRTSRRDSQEFRQWAR